MRPALPLHSRPPWAVAWLGLVLAALAALRAHEVQATLSEFATCGACLWIAALGHDAALLAPAWFMLAFAAWTHHAALRVLLALPALALMLAMSLDVAVLATLGLRLYFPDVFDFGGEGAAIAGFIEALLRGSGAGWPMAAAAGVVACFGVLVPARASGRIALALALAAMVASIASWRVPRDDPQYVGGEAFFNLAELHRAQTVNAAYSPGFARRLSRVAAPGPLRCDAGSAQRPDIVLLVVESLSSYQSRLHGGPFDDTPALDAFARRHTWFSNFHANGFTTAHGLIALLTGEAPVPAIGQYRSVNAFSGYGSPTQSINAPLHDAGYETAFFTSGDLGFLDKAPWLDALGFDHREGAESPFYDGWPRGPFGAAEDRALYLRLERWLDERDSERPFFAAVLTVQSHPPFLDRGSGRLDEHAVMRSVDASLARFAATLEARDFFRHGLLIVVGDHRSMTPLHAGERAAHGSRAFSRVPMIVAGKSALSRGEIRLPFQQTDLLASLRDLAGTHSCATPGEGRFLRAAPQPAEWILFARGDARNRIDVFSGNHVSTLVLDGDDSHWKGTRPPQWRALEAGIHRDRIRRGARDADVAALLELMGR